MKKILLASLTLSFLFISGSLTASAQYYYQNQYLNYETQQYVQPQQYVSVNNRVNDCYYTGTNPVVYYGNCVGIAPVQQNYYQNTYQVVQPVQQQYTYQQYYQNQNTYQQPTTQYQTYGYNNGRWYPGYNHSIIGNVLTNIFSSQSNNCYYQNGYQVCY